MIYFIRSGDFVKIGVADNPWERLAKFQVGSPIELELLAVAPGSFEEESRHHSMFSQHRARGEWYHASQPILDFIQATREKHHKLQDRAEVRRLQQANANKPKNRRAVSTSAVDAVRVVVNTAVAMIDVAPGIDVRSVAESSRGPGILIWIPGYVHNGETVIVAQAAPDAAPTPTEAAA